MDINDERLQENLSQLKAGRISRRDFLRWATLMGVSLSTASALVAACAPAPAPVTSGPPPTSTSYLAPSPLPTAAPTVQTGPKKGGVLRVASKPSAGSFDPYLLNGPQNANVIGAICSYLVWLGPDFLPKPDLATAWEASTDAKTWTFTLRQGVKWNNGADFTADDVVYTFGLLIDPKRGSPAAGVLSSLPTDGIEKVDDHTVRFHLSRPSGFFPYYISTYQAAIMQKDWPGDFLKNPIGTGPFTLKEFVGGEHVVVERNPNFWGQGLPYLDRVEFTFMPEVVGQVTAMASNQIDIVTEADASSADFIAGNSDLQMREAPTNADVRMHMRVDKKPWDDNLVRQAFKAVIDRESMLKLVTQGHGVLGNDSVFGSVDPDYVDVGTPKQDIEKAKALLTQAGYPNGIDVTHTVCNWQLPNLQALAFADMALPAGIRVTVRVEPYDVYQSHWMEPDFGCVGWEHRLGDSHLNLSLRSGVPWNESRYANPDLDKLIDALDAAPDVASQKKVAESIERLLMEEGPHIISLHQSKFGANRKTVQDWAFSPNLQYKLDGVWLSA